MTLIMSSKEIAFNDPQDIYLDMKIFLKCLAIFQYDKNFST